MNYLQNGHKLSRRRSVRVTAGTLGGPDKGHLANTSTGGKYVLQELIDGLQNIANS